MRTRGALSLYHRQAWTGPSLAQELPQVQLQQQQVPRTQRMLMQQRMQVARLRAPLPAKVPREVSGDAPTATGGSSAALAAAAMCALLQRQRLQVYLEL